jgi:LPXTG-site transpeptidase (sortase) family protein
MNLSKTLSRRTLLLVIFTGLALCLTLIWFFVLRNSNQNGSAAPFPKAAVPAKHEPARYGLPVRLKIPAINVDAAVEYVGLTSLGDLDVPKDPANTGWYSLGPRPGEIGSSVIDGHFGYRDNIPAVFDNLYKLLPGDKLYVEDKKGTAAIFVVRESRSYDPQADASDVFKSKDGLAHLNLITCEGTWNNAQKSFSNRLVVFADKE